jgi:hypothetical protein
MTRARLVGLLGLCTSLTLAGACDVAGPTVLETRVVADTNIETGPYEVITVLRDEAGIASVRLFWSAGGIGDRVEMDEASIEGNATSVRYAGGIPGQPTGTVVRWGIEACDVLGNCRTDPLVYPVDAYEFRVGLIPSAPEILDITPDEGPESGGQRVEIEGSDFRAGAEVWFGQTRAAFVEYVRNDLVVALTPAHDSGTIDVRVENPDGETAEVADGYTFLPSPDLISVTPSVGPASGGTPVRLTGLNFFEGSRAFFDDVPCRSQVRLSELEIQCETPPGIPGFVDVEVRHPERGTSVAEDGFFYIAPPRIDVVEPGEGTDLGGTSIVIIGEDFDDAATVLIDGELCLDVEVVSAAEIRCTSPAGAPGVVDVEVVNPDGQSSVFVGGFNYLGPPVVIQVVPGAGPAAGGVEVRVLGAGLTEQTAVFFGDARAEVLERLDSLELIVLLPPTALPLTPAPESGLQDVDVRVVNEAEGDGREDTLANGFTYFWPPEVFEVVPSSGPTAGGTEVLISGRFFREWEDGELLVFFTTEEGEVLPLLDVTLVSPTLIRGTTPPGPEGFVDVTVENFPESSGTLAAGYEYIPPPEVTAVQPPDGPTFGGERVSIIGDNFQEGALVTFDGLPCTGVVFVSETELTCVTPAHEEGVVDVTVINPDGQQGTGEGIYEYLGVVVQPDVGLPVGFTRVRILAAGMQQGVTIRFGDTLATDCQRVSDREAICQTPPHVRGDVDVAFANPDGTGDEAEDGFSYRELFDRTNDRLPGVSLNANDIMAGDVDLDGDLDLLVANGTPGGPEPDEVFFNDGLGQFTRELIGIDEDVSNTVSFGDLNGDNLPDLVIAVSGFGSGGARLVRNDGNGLFTQLDTPGATNGAFDAQLVDLVGDGRDDLFIIAIGCSDGDDIECDDLSVGQDGLFERTGNNANNTWTDRSSLVPHDLGLVHDHKFTAIDVDLDGALDIVTFVDNGTPGFDGFAGIDNRHRILFNRAAQGQGFVESEFTDVVGDVFGIDSGDIDGDGVMDVVAPVCFPATGSSELVYRGNGSTLVQDLTALPAARNDCGVGVHLFDVDTDGDLEVLYVGATGSDLMARLYVNRGDGTFVDASGSLPNLSLNVRGAEATSGDFDGDGDIDVALASVSFFLDSAGDLRLLMLE